MVTELRGIAVGFDLGRSHSQITFYSGTGAEPMAVMGPAGEDGKNYLIPTPEGLFSAVESESSQAARQLCSYFEECFALLKTAGSLSGMTIMVTMQEMKEVWARTIKEAFRLLEVPPARLLLQGHLESFFYYVINQRRELSVYHTALLEYSKDSITAWELWMERRTKPVLVKTKRCFRLYLDGKARKGRGDAEWDALRDELLHKNLTKMLENAPFSCAYLVGTEFEKGWMEKSLKLLCRKRHVFLGPNLYTTGACYGAMEENGAGAAKGYLYAGEDMIEYNLGMRMDIRGQRGYYPLVNAGINWYMAEHTCEFLLNGEKDIRLYSRSVRGDELEHTISLEGLWQRPPRATRIRFTMRFKAPKRCAVTVEDLGLGELYPSSGKKWEAVIKLP